jgi:hypothetical protein
MLPAGWWGALAASAATRLPRRRSPVQSEALARLTGAKSRARAAREPGAVRRPDRPPVGEEAPPPQGRASPPEGDEARQAPPPGEPAEDFGGRLLAAKRRARREER